MSWLFRVSFAGLALTIVIVKSVPAAIVLVAIAIAYQTEVRS